MIRRLRSHQSVTACSLPSALEHSPEQRRGLCRNNRALHVTEECVWDSDTATHSHAAHSSAQRAVTRLAGQQDEEKVSGLEEKTAAGQTGGDAKEAGLGVTEGSDATGLASCSGL
ncbi:hypothetical protein AOLI_G00128900 [Acnodon oligacanthus]